MLLISARTSHSLFDLFLSKDLHKYCVAFIPELYCVYYFEKCVRTEVKCKKDG